jgi:tetratricopeptide (TPR) repeat protein/2-polyprenyl-3-methyl-5-hydroxy-6-metoxy-1,4-benzoquinol methylase
MELTIKQALQQAVEAHKAGKLKDAEALYRAILQAQPKHPNANHNLGVLAVSLNKSELALPLFKTALEANPNQGQFWLSYIDALIKEKQFDNARNVLQQGKKRGLNGDIVDVFEVQLVQLENNLNSKKTEANRLSKVIELRETGRYQEAQDLLTKFLEVEPTDAEGRSLLSQLFLLDNKDVEAEKALATSISINPYLPSIYRNQARLLLKSSKPAEALLKAQSGYEKSTDDPESWIVLATCLVANQRDLEALPLIEKALKARPNYAEAFANRGLVRLRAKNTSDAIEDFEKAVAVKPHLTQIWELLGALRYENKNLSGAIEALKKAHTLEPNNMNCMINLGEFLRQDQRSEEAIAILEEATQKVPENASAWINLGTALQQDNKIENAQAAYKKALAINPNSAEVCNNLGSIAKDTEDWESARKYFEQAITIKPNLAEAHSNLGITLRELGRLEDAETSYNKAIAIKPDYAEAHSNLGVTLRELGRLEDAEKSYNKAIAIKPNLAEAHSNLGVTLRELGRLEDAETSYNKAIAIKPDYAEAHSNLGVTLQELGRLEDALITVIKSIKIEPTLGAKELFIQITKKIGVKIWNQSLADLVIDALLEPWGRPSDLMSIACRLLKVDKEFVQILNQSEDDTSQARNNVSFLSSISKKEFNASSLLQAMLSSSPIPDAEIERFLTLLRHHLLKVASSETVKEAGTEALTPLYCSLAKQCFINEYVYFQTAEEIDLSHQLRDRLIKALEEGGGVSADLVIAVACYFPLYSVTGVEKLLNQKWADDIKSVLRLQIQEVFEELNLHKSIPILTKIDNEVSLAVQSQYEENPYPRWVRLPKGSRKKLLNSYIQSQFPLSTFNRLGDDLNPEILIAGCGTGQHPIGTSQIFKGGKILAVDLSITSLAYAKRKTVELDIQSVDYAQADLLKLASISRTFDVIESLGVLHHLENPFEGWEVLLSLLRPHGLMKLGFYSKLARRDIVRVRNLISNAGIGSTSQEIRGYRKNLLGLKDSENYGFATSISDFFSTSACRDLLFHVQEHRVDLKLLSDFLKDHNLNFLGFDIDNSVIRSYKNRFSNDPSTTNLNQWQIYEEENPNTFIGMYQFWIQKN